MNFFFFLRSAAESLYKKKDPFSLIFGFWVVPFFKKKKNNQQNGKCLAK